MEKYTLVNPETQEEYFDYNSLDTTGSEAIRSAMPGRTDKVWGDIAILMSNSWFSRVWVVQEALMAKTMTFLCGTTTLPAKILFPVADNMMKLGIFVNRLASHSLASWFMNASKLGFLKSRHDRGEMLEIFDVLDDTLQFKASDRRDKVFAMVGLATDIDDTFIDYSKQDPGPMLVRLAKHILGLSDGEAATCTPLNMLSYARSGSASIDVPSWVVDWTSSGVYRSSLGGFYDSDNGNSKASDNERTCQLIQVTDDNVSDMISCQPHYSL